MINVSQVVSGEGDKYFTVQNPPLEISDKLRHNGSLRFTVDEAHSLVQQLGTMLGYKNLHSVQEVKTDDKS